MNNNIVPQQTLQNNEMAKHLYNIFKYNEIPTRFIYISNNEWYVCGKDIATILKYKDIRKALIHVQEKNKKPLSLLRDELAIKNLSGNVKSI